MINIFGISPTFSQGIHFDVNEWQWVELIGRLCENMTEHSANSLKFDRFIGDRTLLFDHETCKYLVNRIELWKEDKPYDETLYTPSVDYIETLEGVDHGGVMVESPGFTSVNQFSHTVDLLEEFVVTSSGFTKVFIGSNLNFVCMDCNSTPTYEIAGKPFCQSHYKRRISECKGQSYLSLKFSGYGEWRTWHDSWLGRVAKVNKLRFGTMDEVTEAILGCIT